MKKKTVIYALISVMLIISNISILYQRELIKIIGKEPDIDSNIHLTVTHRNTILEDGTSVESYSQKDSKKILEYLKSHKYMRTNVKYKKLDNVEYYIIVMKNNGEKVFKAATRGDRYFSVIDKDGRWGVYRVVGDKFDLDFLKDFYKSLSNKS